MAAVALGDSSVNIPRGDSSRAHLMLHACCASDCFFLTGGSMPAIEVLEFTRIRDAKVCRNHPALLSGTGAWNHLTASYGDLLLSFGSSVREPRNCIRLTLQGSRVVDIPRAVAALLQMH